MTVKARRIEKYEYPLQYWSDIPGHRPIQWRILTFHVCACKFHELCDLEHWRSVSQLGKNAPVVKFAWPNGLESTLDLYMVFFIERLRGFQHKYFAASLDSLSVSLNVFSLFQNFCYWNSPPPLVCCVFGNDLFVACLGMICLTVRSKECAPDFDGKPHWCAGGSCK